MDLAREDESPHRLTGASEVERWGFGFGAAGDAVAVDVELVFGPGRATYRFAGRRLGWHLVSIVATGVDRPRPPSMEIRAPGLWADHVCEEPGRRWTLALEAFAVGLDEGTRPAADARGDVVPVAFDLELEAVAGRGAPPAYRRSGRVIGELEVGDRSYAVDADGGWSHEWGPPP